jgi:hypothetical protein
MIPGRSVMPGFSARREGDGTMANVTESKAGKRPNGGVVFGLWVVPQPPAV